MPSPSDISVSRQSRKRRRSDGDVLERPQNRRWTPSRPRENRSCSSLGVNDNKVLSSPTCSRKRRGECIDRATSELRPHRQRKKQRTQSPTVSSLVQDWVSDLPREFELLPEPEKGVNMSTALSLKRTRSNSSASELSMSSDTETNTTLSRDAKNSIYKDPRYPGLMQSKGSFMRDSEQGPLPEELELLETLKTKKAPPLQECTLPPQRLAQLRELLRHRSELRVCIDLHPHLVPSAEYLALLYPNEIKNLAEGHNDRWVDNVVFYQKLPQPDRTIAFSLLAFTDVELRKLQLDQDTKSPFVACHGTLFPFLTAEVKCGKEPLEFADNANTNSMTVALRAVHMLYDRAGQASEINRRFLGFSISHDDGNVRIYAHYPVIDGDKITFHRHVVQNFAYDQNVAVNGDATARFVWNIASYYAPRHLKRLKEAISRLHDPLSPSANSPTPSHTPVSAEDTTMSFTPVTSNSGPTFIKPGPPQRHTSATISQQVGRQHRDVIIQFEQLQKSSKEREEKLLAQLEQLQEREDNLRKEAKEREEKLLAQLERLQAREDTLLARLEQQHQQFMQMLTANLTSGQNRS